MLHDCCGMSTLGQMVREMKTLTIANAAAIIFQDAPSSGHRKCHCQQLPRRNLIGLVPRQGGLDAVEASLSTHQRPSGTRLPFPRRWGCSRTSISFL